MQRGLQRQLVGSGRLFVATVVCLAVVSSSVAVVALTATPLSSAESAPAVALVPLAGPSCTITVPGENPADNAIQTAIAAAAPGSTICIGPGVYPEQLNLSTPGITLYGLGGNSSTILEPNASLAFNTVDFDSGTMGAAIVSVTNTTGVTLEDLQINGSAATSTFTGCGQDYYGVAFQNASGTLAAVTITNVTLPPALFGCQPGFAVYADNGWYRTDVIPSPAVSVSVTNSTIVNYDKAGVVCDDLGESCLIAFDTIRGAGPNSSVGQNGIQVAFGADGTILNNYVAGNAYDGVVNNYVTDTDYFTPGADACGILVFDAGSTLRVTGNVLSGNDIGIALQGTASATVSHNTILQANAYGITFDLNASVAYLGLPVLSSDHPWTSTASDNVLENVPVGIFSYDDNVTITGGSMSNVNVGFEAVTDSGLVSYTTVIDGVTAVTNVSGALLGNISSYQATTGVEVTDSGVYTLVDDTFSANTLLPSGGSGTGILVNGTGALVNGCHVTGFGLGIYVNPAITSATIEASTVTSTAALGVPVAGIWAGNFVYPTTLESATLLITGNTVTGPGGYVDPAIAGGTGIIAGGASVTISNNVVSGFSAISSATANDWWNGTQSAAVMVGCPTTSTAAECLVEGNTLVNNTIGVIVLSVNASYNALDCGPVTITGNTIGGSTGYGIFTEMYWNWPSAGVPPTSTIQLNTFNDASTGAPAMILSGQTFDVTNNVLIGTSATGDQGSFQGQGGGPLLPTASIEATDYWTGGLDTVDLNANVFLETTAYWSATFYPSSSSSLSGGELATFSETGLPSGTPWAVTIAGATGTVAAPGPIVVDLQNSSSPYAFSVPRAAGYGPTPASGTLTAQGAALAQTIVFSAQTYTVTIRETGLPRGASWTLHLSTGSSFSTTQSSLSFLAVNGTYAYSFGVSYAPPRDYSAGSGTFTVSGAAVSRSVTFVPVREMEVVERGLPAGTEWWVNLTVVRSTYVSGLTFHNLSGAPITLYVGLGSYMYTFGSANRSYASPRQAFTVTPVATVVPRGFTASFHLVTFGVTVLERGLPAGSRWCVVLSPGGTHCASRASVTFQEPNGTYSVTASTTRSGYSTPFGTFTVAGRAVSKTLTFAPVLFAIVFTESTLPSHSHWCVAIESGPTRCSSGTTISFVEPNGSYTYSVTTTRAGYSAPGGSFTVSGTAVAKTVTFTA